MKTRAYVTIHVNDEGELHGETVTGMDGKRYASTWVGETLVVFHDREKLVAMRDLCNKQLEEWK